MIWRPRKEVRSNAQGNKLKTMKKRKLQTREKLINELNEKKTD